MINELDEVVLTCDIPDHGLTAGDIGTVVLVHGEGKGFEVKFKSSTLRTICRQSSITRDDFLKAYDAS